MQDWEVLLKGLAAGLAISASVGPVNVLCLSRTLIKGRKAGLVSGFGAATADTIYGAIAGFSIQWVVGFLLREENWIRFFGGMLLIALGVFYYLRRPKGLRETREEKTTQSDWVSAFFLNLTNPTTVLSFMAVLTALGFTERTWWQGFTLVLGIFIGAMLWWTTLAAVVNHFRDQLSDGFTVWMNRVAGVAIGGFGVVTLALSHSL